MPEIVGVVVLGAKPVPSMIIPVFLIHMHPLTPKISVFERKVHPPSRINEPTKGRILHSICVDCGPYSVHPKAMLFNFDALDIVFQDHLRWDIDYSTIILNSMKKSNQI